MLSKILESKKNDIKIESLIDLDNGSFDCSICYENIKHNNGNNYCKLNCNHYFCNNCIKTQLEKQIIDAPLCALCRQEIKIIYTNDKTII